MHFCPTAIVLLSFSWLLSMCNNCFVNVGSTTPPYNFGSFGAQWKVGNRSKSMVIIKPSCLPNEVIKLTPSLAFHEMLHKFQMLVFFYFLLYCKQLLCSLIIFTFLCFLSLFFFLFCWFIFRLQFYYNLKLSFITKVGKYFNRYFLMIQMMHGKYEILLLLVQY